MFQEVEEFEDLPNFGSSLGEKIERNMDTGSNCFLLMAADSLHMSFEEGHLDSQAGIDKRVDCPVLNSCREEYCLNTGLGLDQFLLCFLESFCFPVAP